MTGGRRTILGDLGPAGVGVIANVGLTVLLTVGLFLLTNVGTDSVPRPLVIGSLLATPAIIAAIGIARRRRSLLIGAAIPLIPASFLSWAFVTLPYLIVAFLYVVGTSSLPARPETALERTAHGAQASAVALLILAAGWVALFGLTRDTCIGNAGTTSCGSGTITIEGVLVGAALLLAAVVLSAIGGRAGARP